jgi:putative flippase GtrA
MELILIQITEAWRRRTVLAKLVSFASIGVVNTAVDIAVFSVAYTLLHLPLIVSNVIAWAVAVTGSYATNTKITFGRETGGAFGRGHYFRFLASGILGVIVATTTLVVLSHCTNVLVAKFVSIVAAFGVNFSMSYFVVFRRRAAGAERP